MLFWSDAISSPAPAAISLENASVEQVLLPDRALLRLDHRNGRHVEDPARRH